jgi:hypothetical protein
MKKNVCEIGCTPQCLGVKLLIVGILVILNARYVWFDWGTFVGGLIGIKGLLLLIMPDCICKK